MNCFIPGCGGITICELKTTGAGFGVFYVQETFPGITLWPELVEVVNNDRYNPLNLVWVEPFNTG